MCLRDATPKCPPADPECPGRSGHRRMPRRRLEDHVAVEPSSPAPVRPSLQRSLNAGVAGRSVRCPPQLRQRASDAADRASVRLRRVHPVVQQDQMRAGLTDLARRVGV